MTTTATRQLKVLANVPDDLQMAILNHGEVVHLESLPRYGEVIVSIHDGQPRNVETRVKKQIGKI